MMPYLRANFKLSRLVLVLALIGATPLVRAQALELSASPVGLVGNSAEVGSSLLVAVRVDLADGSERAVSLAATPADWRQAVTVELIRGVDQTVVARAQPVGPASEAAPQVDPETGLSARWLFTTDALKSVEPGEYQLRARLDRGASEALISTWRIAFVPPQIDPDHLLQRTLAAASTGALTGDATWARTVLNEALRADPDRYELLIARGQLALSEGDLRAASLCLRRAAAVISRGAGERPASLHLLAEELRGRSLENPAAQTTGAIDLPPALLLPPAGSGSSTAGPNATPVTVAAPQKTNVAVKGMPLKAPPTVGVQSYPSVAVAPSAPTGSPAKANSPQASAPANVGGAPAVKKDAPSASVTAPVTEPGPGKLVPSSELSDAQVAANARGRWATAATASGSYGKVQYGPSQATGAPNTPVAGNSVNAWCAGRQSGGEEWLEVTFAEPAAATGIRVRQNFAPGAICRVEAIDDAGNTHRWWSGRDPMPPEIIRQITWFGIDVPATGYRVARVRITLDLNAIPGWKQIDAVQLITANP